MRNVAVANPQAAAGRVKQWWQEHRKEVEKHLGPVEVQFTTGPGHATRLAREALLEGAARVIAVGGDGTVNEVVNGFFEHDRPVNPEAQLLVYPGGTGGDFVRSIGMVDVAIGAALAGAESRRIDVGRAALTGADGAEKVSYFINISSFGSSGLIVDKVNRSTKRFGGKTSFFIGTVRGLLAYRNQPVRLRLDDGPAEEHVINTVAVANGRFFGGSMKVAPDAIVDDGLFDVVILGDIGLGQFVLRSGEIYAGTHIKRSWVTVKRAKKVEALPLGAEPVLIDLDGEQPGRLPVRYELLPGAISLLAPWGRAEAVHRT